jgi:hypothetical protein
MVFTFALKEGSDSDVSDDEFSSTESDTDSVGTLSDSDSDAESEAEDASPYEDDFVHYRTLLDEPVPANLNDTDKLRRRALRFLTWKAGKDIVKDTNKHGDATYAHAKVSVKLLLEAFDHETNLKEYVAKKLGCKKHISDNATIKIDDVIAFYTDAVHDPNSGFCGNHSKNTTGMYAVHMQMVYYTLGIPIDYVNGCRPIIHSVDPSLWEKIRPKQREWDSMNAVHNFVVYHPIFGRYLQDLKVRFQYNLHGKKFDLAVGEYMGVEHHEESAAHNTNPNDVNKVLILYASGLTSMSFWEIMWNRDPAYIKTFLKDLEAKLIDQLVANNYRFEQEYNMTVFKELCAKEVHLIRNEIDMTRMSDMSPTKKRMIIKAKEAAIKDWSLLLDSENANSTNKTWRLFHKLYQYKIEGDVARKTNPDDAYAQYVIPKKFVMNSLFKSDDNGETKKTIQHLALKYTKMVDERQYFSWYSLAEFINDMVLGKKNDLKVMNFKLLIKTQELVERAADIKLSIKNTVIERLKSDFSGFLIEFQNKVEAKMDTQRKLHENTVSTLTGELDALRFLHAGYDDIKDDIDKLALCTDRLYNCATYCFGYTTGAVNELHTTLVAMKKNTNTFQSMYNECVVDVKRCMGILGNYIGFDNPHIINCSTHLAELEEGYAKEATHKELTKIVCNLQIAIKGIKLAIETAYDQKVTEKEGKKYKDLLSSIQKMHLKMNKQDDDEDVATGVRLNVTKIGKPVVMGLDKPFPLLLTDKIEDSMLFSYAEGIFKAFHVDTNLLHEFYKLKTNNPLPYKHGVMVPFVKMDTSI